MNLNEKELRAKERICLALDVSTVTKALKLIDELKDLISYFKIGKELHCVAFNEENNIINKISKKGVKIFLDLKFHDTPQTVYRACKTVTIEGVNIIDLHIAGGEKMCKMAIQGVNEEAHSLGIERPKIVGVTVLTSLDEQDLKVQGLKIPYDDLFLQRVKLAKSWGLDGIICPANRAKTIHEYSSSSFSFITPGIKWAERYGIGQKQLYTPEKAIQDSNNSILVIGSSITKAKDRRETTYKIIKAMSEFL